MRERHNPDKKMKGNDLWRDDISFTAVWGWDVALVCAPFGLLNPASGPGAGPNPSAASHKPLLSLHPFTLCSKQPFCTWSFAPFVARFYFSSWLLSFLHKATSEALNITSIRVVEGWICISGWSETHSGTTFKVSQSGGPQGKAHCPQIDPTPLVLFI